MHSNKFPNNSLNINLMSDSSTSDSDSDSEYDTAFASKNISKIYIFCLNSTKNIANCVDGRIIDFIGEWINLKKMFARKFCIFILECFLCSCVVPDQTKQKKLWCNCDIFHVIRWEFRFVLLEINRIVLNSVV